MTWTDPIRFGVAKVLAAGSALLWRGKLNFLAPLTASDNPELGTTDIGVSGLAALAGSADWDVPRWSTTGGAWVAGGFSSVFSGAIPGTATGQLLRWNGSAWVGSTNVTIGSGVISTYRLLLNNFAGTSADGVNMGDGAVIQQNDGGDTIRHVASIDSNGNLTLGPTTGDKVVDCQWNALENFRHARTGLTLNTGSSWIGGWTKTDIDTWLSASGRSRVVKFEIAWKVQGASELDVEDLEIEVSRNATGYRFTNRATGVAGATGATLSGSVGPGPKNSQSVNWQIRITGTTIYFELQQDASSARFAYVTVWERGESG